MVASNKINSIFIIKKNEKGQLVSKTKRINRDKDDYVDDIIDDLQSKFEENHITITSIKNAISTIRKKIPGLFLKYDYCIDLEDSYSKLEPVSKMHLGNIRMLSAYLQNRLNAYYLNKEYKIQSKSEETLAFSHHKSGWTQYVFRLNENYEFISNTNFGYGSVSFFYSIIRYKNVVLSPFSKILEYPFAKYKQVINYSAEHKLQYQEWENSFDFICENYHSALENEELFLEKYFFKNLNTTKRYLRILINLDINAIRIINEKYRVLEENQFNPYELLGNKYCESIKVLKTLEEIGKEEYYQEYYKMLDNYNKEITPILEQGLIEIPDKITFLENEKKKLIKDNRKTIKDQNKNNSRRSRNEKHFNSSSKLEEFLKEKFEDYEMIENRYSNFQLEKQKIKEEITTSKQALKKIPVYINLINKSLNYNL